MNPDSSWPIRGFNGNPVRNRFLASPALRDSLAVLFPGYAYTLDAPLFYYGSALLAELGFDVLAIDYRYSEDDEYARSTQQQRTEKFQADIAGVHDALMGHTNYRGALLVGKSLGTRAILRILEYPLPWDLLGLVWLTPATTNGELLHTLQHRQITSLIAIGTADQFYDKAEADQLSKLPHVEIRVFEGADHGLDYLGDAVRSIRGAAELLESMRGFVTDRLE